MTILIRFSRVAILTVVGSMLLAACGRHKDQPSSGATASAQRSSERSQSASAEIKALPARPNPCSFVTFEDAQRLIGPLSRRSWQAKSADDTTSSRDGRACIFPLTPRDGVRDGSVVAIELRTEDAIGFDASAAVVNQLAKGMLSLIGAKSADGAQHGVDGWDYLGGIGPEVDARIGHVGFRATWGTARAAVDSLPVLLVLMRDHVPDLPFSAFGEGSSRDEGDACSLITREEAEAVLGKLTVPPYHSRDLTPLADAEGQGCSYYTGTHHVLSVQPRWSLGKRLFQVTAGFTQGINGRLGTKGESADTLEGDWDQAGADMAGNLFFLKGDRLLGISYRTSTTDKAGALKLAQIALKRLAK